MIYLCRVKSFGQTVEKTNVKVSVINQQSNSSLTDIYEQLRPEIL